MEITVTSSAFENGGMIPPEYTCDGQDISPALEWESGAEGVKSFAIIADDPDAPMGTWVHWVLFDIPADTRKLAENVPAKGQLDNGARHGTNDFRKLGYGGPCPPSGTHRYYFKVYALDAVLGLEAGVTKKGLLEAMEGHIVGEGELMGRYARK